MLKAPERLAAKILAGGFSFTIPPEIETEVLEGALEDFLMLQKRGFADAFVQLEANGRIKPHARLAAEKLIVIGNEMLAALLTDDGGGEGRLQEIILRVAPEIRP